MVKNTKIQYPSGVKMSYQRIKTSQGGRGMELEKEIGLTNEYYLNNNLAVVHKKPTPVTIVKVDYPKRSAAKITEAYFKIPSTTDYNGIYRTRYIDFEAKECASKTSFPLSSIHNHQLKHLQSVLNQGAIAFVIIRFTQLNQTYYVEAEKLLNYVSSTDKKSIPIQWFEENTHEIRYNYVKPVDYLEIINQLYF
ncbi:MAG: Holliday junction resolvase RecU [Solobacterium sp.]|nr:Holliday junction resolvase RecU [Solobacterium sp.]